MTGARRATPTSAAELFTERLRLVPLTAGDADELVTVLADARLHEFIGGQPASLDELRARYAVLEAGSGREDERWWNWVVRRREDGQGVGTVQVTLLMRPTDTSALVAWVIGVPWQGHGYASEAAIALVEWLHESGVDEIAAHIHPDHHASAAVATRASLHRTDELVDGEAVWQA